MEGKFLGNLSGLKITIREEDNHEKVIDLKEGEELVEGKNPQMVILEKGTSSGKLGVMFVGKVDNKYVAIQLTQGLFEGACKAFEVTKQRFNV